jgi:hypothetical protein
MSGHERELGRAAQALDARLLASGGARVGHRDDRGQLDGQPRAGVTRAAAALMSGDAPRHVARPARVERVVRAAPQQVDHRLAHQRRSSRPAAAFLRAFVARSRTR